MENIVGCLCGNGSILDSVIDSAGALFALGMIGIKSKKQVIDEK